MEGENPAELLHLSSLNLGRPILNTLSAHSYYAQNSKGRDFFIGDIHGKYALLMQALSKINFDCSVDRLFSVEDLIDRGEASFNCLLLAQENWFIPVIGNHEQFLREMENDNIYKKFAWYQNGGGWWENMLLQEKQLAKEIVEKNYALTLSVDTLGGKVGVVHAQYPLNKWPINECDINKDILYELLWSRDCVTNGNQYPIAGIDFIVSGHTPLSKPLFKSKQFFIDTGCGHLPSARRPSPHLTICEFKKEQIEIYAIAEQIFECSKIEI